MTMRSLGIPLLIYSSITRCRVSTLFKIPGRSSRRVKSSLPKETLTAVRRCCAWIRHTIATHNIEPSRHGHPHVLRAQLAQSKSLRRNIAYHGDGHRRGMREDEGGFVELGSQTPVLGQEGPGRLSDHTRAELGNTSYQPLPVSPRPWQKMSLRTRQHQNLGTESGHRTWKCASSPPARQEQGSR